MGFLCEDKLALYPENILTLYKPSEDYFLLINSFPDEILFVRPIDKF